MEPVTIADLERLAQIARAENPMPAFDWRAIQQHVYLVLTSRRRTTRMARAAFEGSYKNPRQFHRMRDWRRARRT